jgi:Protein of unknown function, DUF547
MAPPPLNAPAERTPVDAGPAAERLQAAMLGALGAHLDAAGRVDYDRLAASSAFGAAVAAARALGGARLEALTERTARLAFWINVYNALVLHGVVALGVRQSVRRSWNFFGRARYAVGGFVLSLDDIEHGVLRGNRRRKLPPLRPFGRGDGRLALMVTPPDPRYHFAVSCGAASCPPIGVYRAASIDAQLDLAARGFVNQEVVLAGERLSCSRIFKWYRDDFEETGGLRAFLLRHLDEGAARGALEAGRPACETFAPYRWTLQHPAAER